MPTNPVGTVIFQSNAKVNTYGEVETAKRSSVAEISAINGLSDKTTETVFGTGTATAANSKFICSTGVSPFSFSTILSSRAIAYRAGRPIVATLSAEFTTGVADSQQLAGFVSATDGLQFAYQDSVFGVMRRHNGRNSIKEYNITGAAAGAENATVEVNGDDYIVALTAGTVQHNAFEVAAALNAEPALQLFNFTANDDTVTCFSQVARPDAGAYTFTSATATATITDVSPGLRPTEDFVPQTSWNKNKRLDLNTTLLNNYEIEAQLNGVVNFLIESPKTGLPEVVHQMNLSNTSILATLGDPTMRVGWVASSLGSVVDLVVSGSDASGSISGENIATERPRSLTNTLVGVGTTLTNLLTMRNVYTRGDRRNSADTHLLKVSATTSSSKGAVVQLLIDATVAGETDFQFIDKEKSTTEYDIAGTTVTGGTSIGTIDVPAIGGDSIKLSELMATLESGQELTLAAAVNANPSADVTSSSIFQEDI